MIFLGIKIAPSFLSSNQEKDRRTPFLTGRYLKKGALIPWMVISHPQNCRIKPFFQRISRALLSCDGISVAYDEGDVKADGQHIGMVSSYCLDENFEPTPWASIDQRKNAEENRSIRGLGIEICEMAFWGRGIGAKALTAFMEYCHSLGEHRFLLETWSGNARMLGCARKLGFAEVKRQKGAYTVDGKAYDGLILEKCI